MITIYSYYNNGNVVETNFDSLSQMFAKVSEREIKQYFLSEELSKPFRLVSNPDYWQASLMCIAAYENRRLLRVDYLVGQYRQWSKKYYALQSKKRLMKPRYRGACGHYRAISTFQERKLNFIDSEAKELFLTIKIRGSRRGKNLPSSWDDIISHNDKCWKTQSKRKTQYKM